MKKKEKIVLGLVLVAGLTNMAVKSFGSQNRFPQHEDGSLRDEKIQVMEGIVSRWEVDEKTFIFTDYETGEVFFLYVPSHFSGGMKNFVDKKVELRAILLPEDGEDYRMLKVRNLKSL